MCYLRRNQRIVVDTAVDYVYGLDGSGTYYMDTDAVFVAGANIAVPDIVVMGSHVLENNTYVNTNISLCDGCRLEIHNRGVFNVNFTLADGASVVQVVTTAADVNPINVNVDYELHVVDANGIKLSDVMRIGSGADEILLHDSSVVWDMDAVADLNLTGNINLIFNDIEAVIGRPILSGVDSDAYIRVVSNGTINPMFALSSYIEDGKSYLRLGRETDYTKILDSKLGGFINLLRGDVSSGGLIGALDNAMSVDSLNKIMADSMRIAPINMMDVVAAFDLIDLNNFDYNSGFGTSYLMLDKSYAYGAFVNANINVGNVTAGVRGYVNSLSLSDSFDALSGVMFGGNVYGRYEDDFAFVRGILGGNLTRFNVTNVFDGNGSVDNPMGYSFYGAIDFGRVLDFRNEIFISPYVGATANYMSILHMDNKSCDGRIGVDIKYDFDLLGVDYDYGIHTSMNTDGEFVFGINAGFISEIDMLGGHVAIDYIDNKIGRGYKISAGLDLKF